MKRAILLSGFLIAMTAGFTQVWTVTGSNMYLSPTTAKLGIGTSTPGYQLDVSGFIHTNYCFLVDQSSAGSIGAWVRGGATGFDGNMVLQAYGGNAFWLTGSSQVLKIGGSGGTEPTIGAINIDNTGHVGINTLNTSGYNFNVNGTAVFDQVTVKVFSGNRPNSTPWADYVFDKSYQLPSIYSLADYVKANKHLPGIPTTADVEKNGVDLGATEAKLLEKIEQLTLYTIQLQQQVDSLKTAVSNLGKRSANN